MEREIHFWTGKASSPDKQGWYINWRDENGNIVEVSGPFATQEEASEVEYDENA